MLPTPFTIEAACNFLVKAIFICQQHPFAWMPIDKPLDGHGYLVWMAQHNAVFPNDGIRYLDQEVRYEVPVGGRMMEVHEIKYGFIPNTSEVQAGRTRRRYRLIKGGHASLFFIHYTFGPAQPVPTALQKEAVRVYPIRTVDEPRVFVLGERAGQRVYPPGHMAQGAGAGHGGDSGMGMTMGAPMRVAEKLNHQAAQLEALNNRQLPDRPPVAHDEYDDDEADHLNSRTLAVMRYRRNHELMNEVFLRANNSTSKPLERSNPYDIFDAEEMESKIAKLNAEIEQLSNKRSRKRSNSELQVDPLRAFVEVPT